MSQEVTAKMVFAGIKQADKEGMINGDEVIHLEEYERRVEAWKRIIQAALSAQTLV
jgi:hypothetical protein|tara:strand:+ start:1916 stop:2083 length:168 start_codon:yes stop_codon:yes gene_type:complete